MSDFRSKVITQIETHGTAEFNVTRILVECMTLLSGEKSVEALMETAVILDELVTEGVLEKRIAPGGYTPPAAGALMSETFYRMVDPVERLART